MPLYCGSVVGIANWIVRSVVPPPALTASIASRSVHCTAVQTPSPGSLVALTTSAGGTVEVTVTLR